MPLTSQNFFFGQKSDSCRVREVIFWPPTFATTYVCFATGYYAG